MSLSGEAADLARRVSNWGRWGEQDELGTLNLVTDDVVRRAAGAVRTGKRFPLAIPFSPDGPQLGFIPGRVNPRRTMIAVNTPLSPAPDSACFNDDAVTMGLQAATHWDSLAHVSDAGVIYNNVSADAVTQTGAARCGIDKVRTLVSRGVLLDIPRVHGVPRLDGEHEVTRADLEAAEDLARVPVQPGDVVLIRTGHVQLFRDGDRVGYSYPNPGPGVDAVGWFRERDVAAVATDNLAFELVAGALEGLTFPVHVLDLVYIGLTQGQNFDLEELADDCADDGVYEFLLEATPLPFVGGLGSPVNPVAIK